MIQAVSNFNTMNSKMNFKNASGLSFKGNPLGLIKDEVILSSRASKTIGEVGELVAKKARGIANRNELPITKKPVTAAIDLGDFVPGGIAAAEKNPAKAKVLVEAAIVDNAIFGGAKLALAGKAAAAGTALAGPVGAVVGFLGTYILWGVLRNDIVKKT